MGSGIEKLCAADRRSIENLMYCYVVSSGETVTTALCQAAKFMECAYRRCHRLSCLPSEGFAETPASETRGVCEVHGVVTVLWYWC
jgi:hypothetical protein